MAPLFAHIHLYGTLHREVNKEQTIQTAITATVIC
jgi:hypothetical protein